MTPFGDRVEDTPRSVATVERSSVSAPGDSDPLSLQGEEYHEGGNGDTTRERRGSNAERE